MAPKKGLFADTRGKQTTDPNAPQPSRPPIRMPGVDDWVLSASPKRHECYGCRAARNAENCQKSGMGSFTPMLGWTLALLWEVKRRRTSALPDVAGGAWAFRRFVRVRAKSDNRPAIGSGSPPPRPTASA